MVIPYFDVKILGFHFTNTGEHISKRDLVHGHQKSACTSHGNLLQKSELEQTDTLGPRIIAGQNLVRCADFHPSERIRTAPEQCNSTAHLQGKFLGFPLHT